jgi:hypothetical protein
VPFSHKGPRDHLYMEKAPNLRCRSLKETFVSLAESFSAGRSDPVHRDANYEA